MRSIWPVIWLALFLVGCARQVAATITNLTLTPAIGVHHEPQGSLENLPALLPRVYLVGEVIGPNLATRITVRWYRGGEVLSTQVFTGRRDELAYDFLASPKAGERNFFVSVLEKPDLTWPIGDYRVEVYLGDSLFRAIEFKVVSEAETGIEARRASLEELFFGQELESGAIREKKNLFDAATPVIYLGVRLIPQPLGEQLRLTVEYLPQGLLLASFTQEARGGESLFSLRRSELAPLLGSSFWKSGIYSVALYIDDLLVRKANFRVQ